MRNIPEDPAIRGDLPRLLVLASTLPARLGDGTPGFVDDLARVESKAFRTWVLAPMVPGGRAAEERDGVEIRRYRFFPRRWEDLADGAILENLRGRRSRWLQVPSFFGAGALAVWRAVREIRPDVVHVHWIIPQGLMALVAARRVPWLVTTLGGDLYALTAGPLRLLKQMVLRRAAGVTVMNGEMRDLVIGMGVPPDRVQVLPMGVDLARLDTAAGAGEGGPVPGRLVFVGRLVEKKGLAVLLSALHELPPDLDWSLDVVGDGPLRAELERQARPLGARVRFSGQQSAATLARTLRGAEVAVFPSVRARSGDQDGLPVAMLEAMAAGAAIVASDLPGMAEALHGEEPAGLVVEPGDTGALAASLIRVLSDSTLRARLGAAAASRSAEYSVESIGARYVELLRAAVSTREPRRRLIRWPRGSAGAQR
ncbi:glycosyltransferase [uncultured Modestobacter sp.]|uniref:glycosyltransferase n=1 Tax=uncultured Modestobacter sp. TaxID=380048 RepID=UPI0026323AD3|nr:glycosyltransferase [uncultured Modestobacter sp.]